MYAKESWHVIHTIFSFAKGFVNKKIVQQLCHLKETRPLNKCRGTLRSQDCQFNDEASSVSHVSNLLKYTHRYLTDPNTLAI